MVVVEGELELELESVEAVDVEVETGIVVEPLLLLLPLLLG